MLHSKGTIRNTRHFFGKKIWIFAVLWFVFWMCTGKMTAEAEPASLQSEGAVIYEQTDEGSHAIGNLVQGSSFELLGSVTAEDGSIWYSVSAFGIQGYIRGNAEIGPGTEGTGQAAGTPEREENAGEENAAETGEGNDIPEGAAEAENAEADGTGAGAAGQEEEQPEEEEGEETEEESLETDSSVYLENNQREKTYAVNTGNLKKVSPENAVDTGEEASGTKTGNRASLPRRISKAFLFFWLVMLGSGLTVMVSYKKMKKELTEEPGEGRGRTEIPKTDRSKKAVHKKKKHRRKKGKVKKNGSTKKQ